jgi:thymidylate kinase
MLAREEKILYEEILYEGAAVVLTTSPSGTSVAESPETAAARGTAAAASAETSTHIAAAADRSADEWTVCESSGEAAVVRGDTQRTANGD